ncbi:MAG: hypothetical protein KAJ92_00650 [Gammaproteobacteria bacterium]|nr:hypothetical protein [Gammaproteobacteria bacterium]MCK5262154.1 hypothetical protein [Gammaproteobacteria bacterium]
MEKIEKMPLWVFLAFSSIETRKGALILIWACAIFSLYCIPFPLFFENTELIKTIFLIDDWSWVAMMAPITLWYWISLRWVDNNSGWKEPEAKA